MDVPVGARPGFSGAVLTGGASRRFGSDKTLFRIAGVTLAERVCRALRDAGATEVFSVGGDQRALTALGCFDRHVPDRWPGEGPLGGIVTALEAATADVVVVLACDTPGVGPSAPRVLVESMGSADVALGEVGDREQPLSAAWHRRVAVPLRHAFESGERAPRRVVHSLDVVRVRLTDDDVDDIDRPDDAHRYAHGGPTAPPADDTRSRQ